MPNVYFENDVRNHGTWGGRILGGSATTQAPPAA